MRWRRQLSSVLFALALVTAAIGGATTFADDTPVLEDASPVGESEAVLCGGACLAAGAGGLLVGSAVTAAGAHFFTSDNVNETALMEADAQETQGSIHTAATTLSKDDEILHNSFSNHLEDAKAIALMEAKNEYIRELENDSSETVARAEAKNAADDYYSTRELQGLNSWSASFEQFRASVETARNASGLTPDGVTDLYGKNLEAYDFENIEVDGYGTTTYDLINGTDVQVDGASIMADSAYADGSDGLPFGINGYYGLNATSIEEGASADEQIYGMSIEHWDSQYDPVPMMNVSKYRVMFDEIAAQRAEVNNEIDTFVDSTYSAYTQGEINSTDLVDPYLGAREYSPEGNFNEWAARSTAALGMSMPANYSTFGSMKIEDLAAGTNVTGVLMSDGNPSGDLYEVGSTYNASTLTGSQFVFDAESGVDHELTGEFVVHNVTTTDGQSLDNVTYSSVDYQTADMDEFKALMDDLRQRQAEVEARQQNLREGAGGGGFFGDTPTWVIIVIGLGGAAILLRES